MNEVPVPLPPDDEALLRRARPDGLPPGARGLFADESWLRRVSGEGSVLLGGGCALLLEVAHPLVAAGVAEHSDYRGDPFGRLSRTLAAVNAMAFGDVPAALAAARGVERAHARVRGTLAAPLGRHRAGTRYSGRDPELVRWVWATLAHTAVAVYERFVGPLAPRALDAYAADHAVLARLLGVPPQDVPATWGEFRAFFDATLAGDTLAVGDAARDIARFVLDPPGAAGAPGGGRLRAVTAALLPERLRTAYGLAWDEARRERFEAWARRIRALRGSPGGGAPLDGPAAGG